MARFPLGILGMYEEDPEWLPGQNGNGLLSPANRMVLSEQGGMPSPYGAANQNGVTPEAERPQFPQEGPMPPARPSGLLSGGDPQHVVGKIEPSRGLLTDPQPSAPGAPMQLQGAMQAQPPQAEGPGVMDKISKVLGGLYGAGGPGDGLINLGLALASPGNKAQNIQRGLAATNAQQMQRQQLAAQQLKQQQAQLVMQGNMETLRKAYPDWTPEQLAAAAQNPALVQDAVKRTNPSETFKQETDAQGNVWEVNTQTGQRTVKQAATEQWRPLNDPEERARFGIAATDRTPYKVNSSGNFQAVGTPSTNINTSPGPAKNVYDTMEKRADEARSAAAALPSFAEAKRLVDSGNIVLGAGADTRVAMQKVGALFGLDATAASNSETFRSAVAPTVLAMVKSLGAGSGISNADREFAEKAAGGNITLEPATIKRLLELGEKASRLKVDSHNKTLDVVYPDGDDQNRQVRSLFRVEIPTYEPPAAQAPGSPPPQQGAPAPAGLPPGARQAPDGNYYVPDPARPGKYLKVN